MSGIDTILKMEKLHVPSPTLFLVEIWRWKYNPDSERTDQLWRDIAAGLYHKATVIEN